MLRLLDLFSGIGGFSLGLERSGAFKTVAFCEIDPFCRRVLAKHWPDVPIHDDVTTREFIEGEADAICGGFPCQDVSLAGKRAGVSAPRSGLYRELVRAIRVVRPRIALLENVAALLSDGMGTVLADLAEVGDCVEWDCVPARAVGAPHERDRVWIVAHADGGRRRPGEAGELQSGRSVRDQDGVDSRSSAGRPFEQSGLAGDVADSAREQMGSAGQSRRHERVGAGDPADAADAHDAGQRFVAVDGQMACASPDGGIGGLADAASVGCGQGRSGRPPDSFARIRDEARRNAADPYGARLAFREGLGRDAWEKLTPAQRNGDADGRQSLWPDEPALSGMDDGSPDWMERIKATGNGLVPQIPELIGRAIADAMEREP